MNDLEAFRDGNDLPLTISCALCGQNNGKRIRRAQLEENMKMCLIEDKIALRSE